MMESEEESCKVHVPDDFEEKTSFLVNFSNGQLVRSKMPNITLYTKTKDRTKRKKILVAETRSLAYVGTNFGPGNAALSNSCQYCVGSLDRSTGVMTLHKTELMTLNPYIPGTADVEVGEEISIPDDEEGQFANTQKSVSQMVEAFGSEKRKRAYSTARRNMVGTDVLETALEPAFSHAEANIEKTPSTGAMPQDSGLMPPHNPAAESPQDVYDINDIIPLSELKILKCTAKDFAAAASAELQQWKTECRYPEYIIQHMQDLPSTEPSRSLVSALLLLANYLIQLHNINSRRVQREGLYLSGILPPAEVMEHLLNNFTEKLTRAKKPQYSIPARMKDKIRLHLFVLCLIIDDFSVKCSVLQKDLKITTNKMTSYFKALGCVVKKGGVKRPAPSESKDNRDGPESSIAYVLSIPPAFPRQRVAGKRKE